MDRMQTPGPTVPVRIRFAGTQVADTFHLTSNECARFHADWKNYVEGKGPIGGEYASEEADHPMVVSINFSLIAYIEPGKRY